MSRIDGWYFDGRSSAGWRVSLELGMDVLKLSGGAELEYRVEETRVEDRVGSTPRRLRFSDGAVFETEAYEAVDAWLSRRGICAAPWWQRMERYTGAALAGLLLTAACYWAGVVYGIPALAEFAAFRLPEEVDRKLGEEAWRSADRALFTASALTEETKRQVDEQFRRVIDPATAPQHRLEFRHGGAIGANALAFPGGIVVVTDELVLLAQHPEEVAAVLAHEAGHLHYRHGLRMALEQTSLGLLAVVLTGDPSWLGAGIPLLLIQNSYTRDFERQADDYAVRRLRALGIAPGRLAEMLERLERQACKSNCPTWDWFSTHPAARERAERITRGQTDG
ncbi:M48 family metallopeptidase [Methylococcus sp. EFPC2]|uniref:M48 family metallopeptidase n=1 Tax=Methylococcus sp. EFPC2 TaxID=2812648 RepID=UPI001967E834|nr:M48 family metallopeptidase [Methylococcus sp. EFPC2]QSA97057.1 M48 family metallopeptidase [Methylococcus sp. EFPC2]